MRFFGIILCLIALVLTGYSALVYKAPKIEADIQARAEEALADAATQPIEVFADGRHVTLRGTVANDQEREQLLEIAGKVWGGLGPIDALDRLTVMSPYRFEATKDQAGKVVVEGFAPSAELRDLMTADAETIFGADADIRIDLASGAPPGDWRGIAGSGMDALATLDEGGLAIVDGTLTLTGSTASSADAEAVEIFAQAAPEGFAWTNNLSVPDRAGALESASMSEPKVMIEPETTATSTMPLEEEGQAEEEEQTKVEPFTLTVEKDRDGSLTIRGFAPDDATRTAFIDQAKAVAANNPLIADIQIADGMPDADWPNLVQAGIGAMGQVEAGKFDVIDNDASFAGDVANDDDLNAIREIAGTTSGQDDWTAGIQVRSATADPETLADQAPPVRPHVMTVDKTDDGAWWLEGVASDAQARDQLLEAIKEKAGVDNLEAEISLVDGMPGDEWHDFIVDRVTALKAVKSGRLSFKDYEAHLIGVVDTPEDIDDARTRLAAIDSAMTTDLNPVDPRPVSALDLVISPEKGVTLWGSLPEGLSEKEAVAALGLKDYQGGLSDNGRGDADVWRDRLAAIGGYLPQFEHVGVTLGPDGSRVEGRLHGNGDADQIKKALKTALDDDQTAMIDVEVTELTYSDGTRRKNPLTGKEEEFDRGYWLPIVTFAPGLAACREQSSIILASNKITFLRGDSTLDARAEEIVDDLAAIAIKCLEDENLKLQIGGHTDARGAESMNRDLSQKRADAVLRSLTERGVNAASLIANGYGETEPIADNGNEEGRAKNRRITFEWEEAGTKD